MERIVVTLWLLLHACTWAAPRPTTGDSHLQAPLCRPVRPTPRLRLRGGWAVESHSPSTAAQAEPVDVEELEKRQRVPNSITSECVFDNPRTPGRRRCVNAGWRVPLGLGP
jgi:hypothetical protein